MTSFAIESISSGPSFLKSRVTLLHTKRFQNISIHSPGKNLLCPSEYWDIDRKKDQKFGESCLLDLLRLT